MSRAFPGSQTTTDRTTRGAHRTWRTHSTVLGAVAVALCVAFAVIVSITAYSLLHGPFVQCPCPSVPYELGMEPNGTENPSTGLFYEALALSPTLGLTTGMFGLMLFNASGGEVAVATVPPGCVGPDGGVLTSFGPTECGATSEGWYAVLVYPNMTVESNFGSSGHWSGTPVALELGASQIYVVSSVSYAHTGATLRAYSIGRVSVAGSVYL